MIARRSVILTFAGMLAGAAVAGGVATAATTSNVVHACVAKRTGAVRIVAAGTQCARTETSLQWNQTGPQGLVGPEGPQGPAGSSALAQVWESTGGQVDVPPGGSFSLEAGCYPGVPISGGMKVFSGYFTTHVYMTGMHSGASAGEWWEWRTYGYNPGPETATVAGYAMCTVGTFGKPTGYQGD